MRYPGPKPTNGWNPFLPFFLHDVVLPEEMLEPTSVPFSFDHGLPLNNNTEQTRSLPHRDKNIHTSASLDSPLSQRHSALPRKTKDCNREQNFVPGHTTTPHPRGLRARNCWVGREVRRMEAGGSEVGVKAGF